jgi:colanic acid biosynthesis protein WcaH
LKDRPHDRHPIDLSMTAASRPMPLSHDAFLSVVRDTPLVSIDLAVVAPGGRLLMGRRTNEPARGFWFVPGGRILKGEPLDEAYARLTAFELGVPLARADATLLGLYTHLYETNFAEAPGVSTHYVVIAYRIDLKVTLEALPRAQHSGYRWWAREEAIASGQVHPNNFPYFPPPG